MASNLHFGEYATRLLITWIVGLFLIGVFLFFALWGLAIDEREMIFTLIMIIGASISFIVLSARFIYEHAKAYNRRAVAWATAFIIFSPLWAGLLYLLTWPSAKSK